MRRRVQPEIVQAAIKLFGLSSFKGVTTRALAKEARVDEPAIYFHFKNKESLYLEAVNTVVAQYNEQLSQFVMTIFEDPTPAKIGEAIRKWFAAVPLPSARLLLQVLISDEKRRQPASLPLDQIISALAKALERQARPGRKFNPQVAAKTLVRSLFWTRVIEGDTAKAAEKEMDEVIQQWLFWVAHST